MGEVTREPVREPAVAGRFYQDAPSDLRAQIEECFTSHRGPGALPEVDPAGPRRIVGMASPHAGYVFSGPGAAAGYARLAADGVPSVAIIIAPSHGMRAPAIQTSGSWRTPLGHVAVAAAIAEGVADMLADYSRGPEWFGHEHSLEVQLPFLQYLYGDAVPIVPIMMLRQGEREARQVADAVKACVDGTDAVIIASTDMTHEQPAEVAAAQDALLVERMLALDPVGLLRTRPDITMCGRGPVAAMLMAAQRMGAVAAEQVSYTHSGEVLPGGRVVGYASVIVTRDR